MWKCEMASLAKTQMQSISTQHYDGFCVLNTTPNVTPFTVMNSD